MQQLMQILDPVTCSKNIICLDAMQSPSQETYGKNIISQDAYFQQSPLYQTACLLCFRCQHHEAPSMTKWRRWMIQKKILYNIRKIHHNWRMKIIWYLQYKHRKNTIRNDKGTLYSVMSDWDGKNNSFKNDKGTL